MKSIHIKWCNGLLMAVCLLFQALINTAIAHGTRLPTTLTLTEAIQMAVKQNPEVKASRFKVDSVGSEVVQARSGFFPQIYFSETFNRTTNPMWAFGTKLNQEVITQADFDPVSLNDPDAINNFATSVSMAWTVYDGGETISSWKQAQHNHAAASLIHAKTRQEIIARTAIAYMGLLLAQENRSVVKQTLETAKANLKMVWSRFKSGLVVKSDFLRAKVRIAELEQQLLGAESQVKVAQALLNASMGKPTVEPFNLVTPFKKCAETSGSIKEWINTALLKRPDLKKMQYQEKMAQEEIDRARAGHLPGLQLVGNYEINSEKFKDSVNNYTVGAVVRINLYSGQRISAKLKAAKSSLLRFQELRKSMELAIRLQTRESYLRARSAWQRIQVAQTAVDQAEEGLRIVKNRYNNGLLTIVALLDSEVALQQARVSLFKALHDYKVARIQLVLAAGTIDTNFR